MELFSKVRNIGNIVYNRLWVYDEKNNLRTNHCIAYGVVGASSVLLWFNGNNLYSRAQRLLGNSEE